MQQGLKKAYFASGCFWCVEAVYESVKGVTEAYSGYAGGFTINPNYNQIGTGKTGHAEAIEVIYDPNVVSFSTLLQVFFGSHDPTTPNRQGPDRGSQYRSIAFYTSPEEQEIIVKYIELLQEKEIFSNEIVTEIKPLEKFYYAEEYHQNYEKNNPNNPYVRQVSIPRLRKFQNAYPELLKENH
jgi:peptide-methionine (S)-S-oxide reductase